MTVVAVIAEYNPFHNGHYHHLKRIREEFGEDTAIIILLSSNLVQRGDVAIYDKYTRADAAIACGADLVLELLYPYSCASAESYAFHAVSLLNELSCVDYLSFGSECGDLSSLLTLASNLQSEEFRSTFLSRARTERNIGHASLCERIYRELYGETSLLSTPNNTLAVQYLLALRQLNSPIRPHTILRESNYHTGEGRFPSATSLRKKILSGDTEKAKEDLPAPCHPLFSSSPTAILSRLSPIILSHLTLHPPKDPELFADCEGGLGHRLMDALADSFTIEQWLCRARSSKYTLARTRRAMIHLYMGTTREMIVTPPAYTQLLSSTITGRKLLKAIKKDSSFTILTKPADYTALPPIAAKQAQTSHRADLMYAWALDDPHALVNPLRRTPKCEK